MRALNTARTAYFSSLINNNKHNSRFLFNTVAKLTQKTQSVSCAPFNANYLLDFFCNKIDEIRVKINSHLWLPRRSLLKNILLPISVSLSSKHTISPLRYCLKLSHPQNQLPASWSPFWQNCLKLWSALGPTMLNIVNSSLMTGDVPASFKSAVVKKPHLDRGSLNNYWLVSNFPFFSIILERVLSQQLSRYLHNNILMEPFQSIFRAWNSPYLSGKWHFTLESNSTPVLLLLDLSAAFDNIDHGILSDRLESQFGISGLALPG